MSKSHHNVMKEPLNSQLKLTVLFLKLCKLKKNLRAICNPRSGPCRALSRFSREGHGGKFHTTYLTIPN